MDKLIIDRNTYFKLKKLLDSNNQENWTLLHSIIENCDIEKSFVHLLNLFTKSNDEFYSYSSKLSCCAKLYKFIRYLSPNAYNTMVMELNEVIGIYDNYNQKYCPDKDPQTIKSEKNMLIKEYNVKSKISKIFELNSKSLKKKSKNFKYVRNR